MSGHRRGRVTPQEIDEFADQIASLSPKDVLKRVMTLWEQGTEPSKKSAVFIIETWEARKRTKHPRFRDPEWAATFYAKLIKKQKDLTAEAFLNYWEKLTDIDLKNTLDTVLYQKGVTQTGKAMHMTSRHNIIFFITGLFMFAVLGILIGGFLLAREGKYFTFMPDEITQVMVHLDSTSLIQERACPTNGTAAYLYFGPGENGTYVVRYPPANALEAAARREEYQSNGTSFKENELIPLEGANYIELGNFLPTASNMGFSVWLTQSIEGESQTPAEKQADVILQLSQRSRPASSYISIEGYELWYRTYLEAALREGARCIKVANEYQWLNDQNTQDELVQQLTDQIVTEWMNNPPQAQPDNSQAAPVPTVTPTMEAQVEQPPNEPPVTRIVITATPQPTPLPRNETSFEIQSLFTDAILKIRSACVDQYSSVEEQAACEHVNVQLLFLRVKNNSDRGNSVSAEYIDSNTQTFLADIAEHPTVCSQTVSTTWNDITSGQSELWQTGTRLFAYGSYSRLSIISDGDSTNRTCALVTDAQLTYEGGLWQTTPQDPFAKIGSVLGRGQIDREPPGDSLGVSYAQVNQVYLYPLLVSQ